MTCLHFTHDQTDDYRIYCKTTVTAQLCVVLPSTPFYTSHAFSDAYVWQCLFSSRFGLVQLLAVLHWHKKNWLATGDWWTV